MIEACATIEEHLALPRFGPTGNEILAALDAPLNLYRFSRRPRIFHHHHGISARRQRRTRHD
jgi:hypothetical protein